MVIKGDSVLKEYSKHFMATGIVMLIFGLLLIIFPFIGTIAIELMFGAVLLVLGVVGIVIGALSMKWKGAVFIIFNGIFATIFGLLLLFYPIGGIIALTLFIGALMLVQGIFEMVKSAYVKDKFWKRAILFDGIFSFILGILVMIGWPYDSAYVIGLLLGISLLFSGLTFICFSKAK